MARKAKGLFGRSKTGTQRGRQTQSTRKVIMPLA
jgi:hypothetical protein